MVITEPEILRAARTREAQARSEEYEAEVMQDPCRRRWATAKLRSARDEVRAITLALENSG